MNTLANQFQALSTEQKRIVHILLCGHALEVWHDFVATRGKIQYTESVCGTTQVVDPTLPDHAFRAANWGQDSANVGQRYLESIAAMQDKDLEFAKPVEFAYYAAYNLFLKYACHENIDDWLIVNQTLSSQADESKWVRMFQAAIDVAIQSRDP